MRRKDAAKIYELAYFATDDVLNESTNNGLSVSILSEAVNRKQFSVVNLDMDQGTASKAEQNFERLGLENIITKVGDATNVVQQLLQEKKTFGFAFVDHSHEYEPVRSLCAILSEAIKPGSYVAFHDFVDKRNSDPNSDFDVPAAVINGLGDKFAFVCCVGCMGVYQHCADVA